MTAGWHGSVSSFGSYSGTAAGVPLTVDLTVQRSTASCATLAGAAVYLWQCDRDGGYSLHSQGVTELNYLRGVQVADANGRVSFTSIFPACYSGRWPHIHFEVYASQAEATGGGNPISTSQLALPQAVCDVVYATTGYQQSITNLSRITLESDNVFGEDGAARQLASMGGSVGAGFTAALSVPVPA